jgi:hypothetical protein
MVMNNWDIIEGNLRAIKDFNTKDMWDLYIKSTNSGWVPIQWLSTGRIQEFFNTKLPQQQ